MSIYNEPPPGMCIVPDKEDITKVCTLSNDAGLHGEIGMEIRMCVLVI